MAALFSEDGVYRYWLRRELGGRNGMTLFVMLNPSTADAVNDDPTIRRCIGFARNWGASDMVAVNLFAYRATRPVELKLAADPVGPGNDGHILEAAVAASQVVLAWGVHGELMGRSAAVVEMLRRFQLRCLGVTSGGHPRHPLYLPLRTRLEAMRI